MTTIVYVSNADSGSVSVLALDDASGAPGTLQTLELGGVLMPMALAPRGHRLYVARRDAPESVHTLAVDPASGRLTALAERPLPASMAHLSTDRSGRFLFSASYGGDLLAVSPIDGHGIAQAPIQVLPTPPKSHALRVDASNRFAWSTVLGGDAVLQWRFDATTGRLAPNDPPALAIRPGAGARHLVQHPQEHVLYLLNELDATLDVLAVDAGRGTLAPLQTVDLLPAGYQGERWAADLQLTPDGRFLYASERASSTLAAFRIDRASGRLTALSQVPVQAQPRSFAIEPTGRLLLVAGQLSHRLGVHAIDPASGALTLLHEHPVGQNPNWVEALRLG